MVEPTVAALPAKLAAMKADIKPFTAINGPATSSRVWLALIAVAESVQVARSECNWHDCARPCGCDPLDKALKELAEALA